MTSQYIPGLRESGDDEVDITSFEPPERKPDGVIRYRGKMSPRRKARIRLAFKLGRRRGWKWRYEHFSQPDQEADQ